MADLFNLKDTQSLVAAWRDEYRIGRGLPAISLFAGHVERAAKEQRANYESATSGNRAPTWCKPAEYLKCVELLETTARRARRGIWPAQKTTEEKTK